jgi:hypothetical protein
VEAKEADTTPVPPFQISGATHIQLALSIGKRKNAYIVGAFASNMSNVRPELI